MLEDTHFDAFAAVFLQVYNMGCKGCTTFGEDAYATPQNKPNVDMDTDGIVL